MWSGRRSRSFSSLSSTHQYGSLNRRSSNRQKSSCQLYGRSRLISCDNICCTTSSRNARRPSTSSSSSPTPPSSSSSSLPTPPTGPAFAPLPNQISPSASFNASFKRRRRGRAGLLRILSGSYSTDTRRYATTFREFRLLPSPLYRVCVKNKIQVPTNDSSIILLQLADRPLGQPRPRSSLRNCFRGQTGPFPKPHQHLVFLLASSRSWLRARRTRPAPSSCTLPNFPVPCPVPTSSLRIPPIRAPHCRS